LNDPWLASGDISHNADFPDTAFLQMVLALRRLKTAWDELMTTSATNNIASIQSIDEAVLQFLNDLANRLTKLIGINK